MTIEIRTEPKKKPAPKDHEEAPVHVIREGAIAASIWRRTTGHGLDYFEYTLSRSWKSKTQFTLALVEAGYAVPVLPPSQKASE